MAHLKKSASGHLLKGASGHLVKDCTGATENTCNDCDPPLPDTLYVTLAGLQGDLAVLNGTHQVEWYEGCRWQLLYGPLEDKYWVRVWGLLYEGDFAWAVTASRANNCDKVWLRISEDCECAPAGAYDTERLCYVSGCDDKTTCNRSQGATCVVSAT